MIICQWIARASVYVRAFSPKHSTVALIWVHFSYSIISFERVRLDSIQHQITIKKSMMMIIQLFTSANSQEIPQNRFKIERAHFEGKYEISVNNN